MTTSALTDGESVIFHPASQTGKVFPYEWDASTGVVIVSGGCAEVLGVNEGVHTAGTDVLPNVYPDDGERVTAALTGLTPETPHTQISYRTVHPERGVIWVEIDGRATFDAAGKLLRITGMVADIAARKLAEISEAMGNDWLRLAMEAGNTVGWEWDVKSGRDFWFGNLQSVFGIPASNLIGHVDDFRRYVHPEDGERGWNAVRDAMQNQKPYAAEFRVIRQDGAIRWVTAQGRFYYLPNGEPERMLGIAVDITDLKVAEDAVRRKDRELTEAQRLAGVGSWRWDPQTDTVLWSEELYRIAGRDPKLPAVSYGEHAQLYTAESWARLQHAVVVALRTGAPYELELEMVQPDGTTKWVIGRGEAQFDAAGHVFALHGTLQDITERRKSREALRESEERLRLAAQAGRMYAFEWERATDLIVRSAEFTHILGLTDETKDTTCQEMLTNVHPDDRAKVAAATNGCTPENPWCRIKYRLLRPDGSVVWLEKNAHAFFDAEGRMFRMIGMVADITERKVAEEALSVLSRRLIEAQETERARIARDLHDDIGQRLALLSVTLEHLKQAAVDSTTEVRCRMEELRQQILDISAGIHALTHDLHSPTLRHLGVVKAMHSFCKELSEQQNVDIDFSHTDMPGSVPNEISLCLYRVLQEALHNALKHSKTRYFEVRLRRTQDAVHLTVRDSGLGFDPKAISAGNGLGLTSMEERLKLVDGELYIDSKPQHGTTVHARVPLGLTSLSARASG